MVPMSKKRMSLGDQIREAVKAIPTRRQVLCDRTGIDKGSMSRFVAGKVGLNLETLDRLAAALRLRIVQDGPKRKAR